MKIRSRVSKIVLRVGAVSCAAVAAVGILLQGCARPQQSASREGRSGRTSQVVSPLTVTIPNPERLSSINCLAVAQPSFAREAVGPGLTPDSVQPTVQGIADRVLGLKIVAAPNGGAGTAADSKVALEAMRRSGADAVLLTEVQSFRERGGSAIGGDPATVAFTMTIKSTTSGTEIWKGQYFYQEEALTDNLLKLGDRLGSRGSGAGWSSGRELFERAVETTLSDFGTRRESQFLAVKP